MPHRMDRYGIAAGRDSSDAFARRLAAIVLAGVAARVAYVLLSRHVRPAGDSDFFFVMGQLLAAGHGFENAVVYHLSGDLVPTALHPPVFPLLLGAIAKIGVHGYVGQRVVLGCLLGAGTITAVALLARRIGGPPAGLLAAAIAALDPMLVGADAALMSEALFGLLVVCSMLVAYAMLERPTLRRAALLGALVGAATLTRGEGILLLALLAVPLAVRRSGTGAGRRRAQLAVTCLVCLVVIAPWGARNWHVFHHFVPISNNDGTLLAGANCGVTYHGPALGAWRLACIPRRGDPNEAEAARVYRDAGTTYAVDHLGRLPVVLAARAGRSLGVYGITWEVRHSEGRLPAVTAAGLVTFLLLLPLAFAAVRGLRRRGEPLFILAAPAIVTAAVTLLGYGAPRFRHPLDLVVAALAGVAVHRRLAQRDAASVSSAAEPPQAPTRRSLRRRRPAGSGRSSS